jgi:hypothetical protein
MLSSIAAFARPVRSVLKCAFSDWIELSIRCCTSLITSLIGMLNSSSSCGGQLVGHDRADVFTQQRAFDVAFLA